MKNKKAVNLLTGTIIFLVLFAAFLAIAALFLARVGAGADMDEQIYSKKIAIIIDSMKPGTEISLDISRLYEDTRKNNYNLNPVIIDYKNNTVSVQVEDGEGHSYRYFSILEPGSVSLNENEKKLIIKLR